MFTDLVRQLNGCWHPPAALRGIGGPQVQVIFSLNRDGSLAGSPVVKQSGTGPLWQAAVDSAVQAVRECTAPPVGPLHLPPAEYEIWKEVEVNLTPGI